MSEDTYQALEEAVRNHLAKIGGGRITTAWILVAETCDPDDTDPSRRYVEMERDDLSGVFTHIGLATAWLNETLHPTDD